MEINQRRKRFFDETLKLIHQKGFKATTMRAIANELDFEVANVYNYVDSKQALLEQYLFRIQDEFHESIDHILNSTYNPKEKLRQLISSYVQITSKRPYEQAILVNEWRNLKGGKLQEFIARREAYEEKVKRILHEGLLQNQFKPMDLEVATDTVLASLRWIYKKYITTDLKINPLEIEQQLNDFIFYGIVKHEVDLDRLDE